MLFKYIPLVNLVFFNIGLDILIYFILLEFLFNKTKV